MYQLSFLKNNKTPFAYMNHRLLTKASEHHQKLIMLMRIGNDIIFFYFEGSQYMIKNDTLQGISSI